MFDVIVDFPKMKVAVATRGDRVAEIRYLPPAVELARRLGAEARAIGRACGDNLLEAKRWLLMHECGADEFELRA